MSHHWIYNEVFDNMAKHYSFSESFIHRKVWKSEKLKKFIKIMITKCWRFKIGMKKCYINPTRSMIHTKRINCPKSQGSTNENFRIPKAKNCSIRSLIPAGSQEEVSTPDNTIQMKPRAEVYSEQRKLYVKRNTLKWYYISHMIWLILYDSRMITHLVIQITLKNF